MYERMLNKNKEPTIEEIHKTIGTKGTKLLNDLNHFLQTSYELKLDIKFPFGNSYGWGIKFSHKSKHLCYIFPENNAFTVTIQIGKNEVMKLQNIIELLLPKTQELWKNRYPCGSGGWIHYRVLSEMEVEDIKKLIMVKKKPITNI